MGTFKRVKFTTLDNAPLQVITISNPATGASVVDYRVYNSNSQDAWVGAYNETSGVVNVGTTAVDYGKFLVPAGAERVPDKVGTEQNPLFFFTKGVTFVATTTEPDSGNTALASDLTIELFYYI